VVFVSVCPGPGTSDVTVVLPALLDPELEQLASASAHRIASTDFHNIGPSSRPDVSHGRIGVGE
jgi:hypothetical protein